MKTKKTFVLFLIIFFSFTSWAETSTKKSDKEINQTYWRNEKTGNWDIAFLKDYVIYDCQFWNYKQAPFVNKDKITLFLTNGKKDMQVIVGKEKNGHRTIQIEKNKCVYAKITSQFLPDYPKKDIRSSFVDTDFKTDSVTLLGWLKDMPKDFNKKNEIELVSSDFFTSQPIIIKCNLDSLGRFCIKFPIINSSKFSIQGEKWYIPTLFEPGQTYFLLYDYAQGRQLFMGEDARLQNELCKYSDDWKPVMMREKRDFDQYITQVDQHLNMRFQHIDSLSQEHLLSTRFNKFSKTISLLNQARVFSSSIVFSPHFEFSDQVRQYAYEHFWKKIEKPYSLSNDFCDYVSDFFDDLTPQNKASANFDISEHLNEITDEKDHETIEAYDKLNNTIEEACRAESSQEGKERVTKKLEAENAKVIAKYKAIFDGRKTQDLCRAFLFLRDLKNTLHVIDSLGGDNLIKDMVISQAAYNHITRDPMIFPQSVVDSIKALITHPFALDEVIRANDEQIALVKNHKSRAIGELTAEQPVISDGEKILAKLIEPYKGAFILIDIWGTWCAPCKEALSHSQEEYARLAPYNVVYLYLAKHSPQEQCERIIEQYQVKGPNVVHYNLPDEQQQLIEQFFNIGAYPTYKLIDRNGYLLDVDADPSNINSLIHQLEQ